MPACTVPVNVYEYVHELLRTRALWQNNCQISFRLLKSSKNPQLHRQQLLPANLTMCRLKCSYIRSYDSLKFHISKFDVPYIRV